MRGHSERRIASCSLVQASAQAISQVSRCIYVVRFGYIDYGIAPFSVSQDNQFSLSYVRSRIAFSLNYSYRKEAIHGDADIFFV